MSYGFAVPSTGDFAPQHFTRPKAYLAHENPSAPTNSTGTSAWVEAFPFKLLDPPPELPSGKLLFTLGAQPFMPVLVMAEIRSKKIIELELK